MVQSLDPNLSNIYFCRKNILCTLGTESYAQQGQGLINPTLTTQSHMALLTAIVLSSHGSDDKKYVATGRRITDALKERKRSRYEQSTLLIKDFKYGPSLSIFVLKK